ncbi:hypothetical protein BJ138DRAFT_1123004 [Hygrophoropsis aurantiaca]|uniref:Uncharacterized protein n=1 Tax=Hygrophoropsis aurantiaca TaxID=72124 RepID=A0ACB8AQ22_9AGAM|nr:hypothetical protein BJ138DRAFT_1123004 [Hygrophoropsis aurantiaca]
MSTAEQPPFPLGPNYGAMFFSMALCVGLYGVTSMQTFLYFVRYQEDVKSLKFLVISIWLLDTVHQGLVVGGTYNYLVPGFGDYRDFVNINLPLMVAPLFTSISGVFVQGFFVRRLAVFWDRKITVPAIWAPAAILQLVVPSVFIWKASNAPTAVVLDCASLKATTVSYLATTSAVDIIISGSLAYLLSRERTTGQVRSYERVLQRLAIYSINSGAWTAIFSLLAIITFVRLSGNEVYVIFDFPLCPLYCNALLANLNVRSYVRSLRKSLDAEMGVIIPSFIDHERRKGHEIKKLSAVVFAHTVSPSVGEQTVIEISNRTRI